LNLSLNLDLGLIFDPSLGSFNGRQNSWWKIAGTAHTLRQPASCRLAQVF
jgi:hypothetical protein